VVVACGKKCDQERKRESHERKGEKQRKYCTETVDVTNSGRTSPPPNNLLHMAKSESKTCQEFLLQCRAVECIVACISLSLSRTFSDSEPNHMLSHPYRI
jgi:hypothetical protein